MDKQLDDFVQHASNAARDLQTQANNVSARVSTWVMAGNGGALLLSFNALIDERGCDWNAVRGFVGLFLLGLISAFGCVAFSLWVTDSSARRTLVLSSHFRQAAYEVDQLNRLRTLPDHLGSEVRADMDELERKVHEKVGLIREGLVTPTIDSWLNRLEGPLLGVGVACFVTALFCATWGPSLQSALCAGE